MKKLKGVVVPIVTPLTEEDQIDIDSLKNLVDHCIHSDLQAIYPCGTTGEMMCLTVEERKLVAETVVKHTDERVPVFVHVGAWNLKDTIELAKHAYDIGADGIAVVTPSFFPISEKGLIDYFESVSQSVPSDYPVYLYAIPQYAMNDVSVDVAKQAAHDCQNIIGIKYSYPDMTRIQQMMRINDNNFSVLAGPDQLFTAVVSMGGDGVVSGSSQVIPAYYESVWKALEENNYEKASCIQQLTNKLNEELCKYNNIAAYKAVLRHTGIIKTSRMRKPLEELTPEKEKELLTSLKEIMQNRDAMNLMNGIITLNL